MYPNLEYNFHWFTIAIRYFHEIDDDNVYLMDSTVHTLGNFQSFIRTPLIMCSLKAQTLQDFNIQQENSKNKNILIMEIQDCKRQKSIIQASSIHGHTGKQ